MWHGTPYFVSLDAAVRYYAEQRLDRAAVERKLATGEIHIGEPALAPGERLFRIDGGDRYAVETPDPE